MSADFDLHLASESPRRGELLAQIGLRFRRVASPVDETPTPGETPDAFAHRIAVTKARAGRAAVGGDPRPVIGADTCIDLDGRILGKPADRDDALAMLAALSGRAHRVLSAVALADGDGVTASLAETRVVFRDVTAAEAAAYWASGEPRDKAGAYAIQGLGAVFVRRLEGSYSAVMGLPLFETARLLRAAGVRILDDREGGA